MTKDELAALDAAATPGPWHNYVANGGACSLRAGTGALDPSTALCGQKDGMLIAYLRNAVPDILALIEERDRLRERVIGEAHSAKMLEIALRAICEPVGGTLPDAEVCRCIALSAIADQANRRAALAGEKP